MAMNGGICHDGFGWTPKHIFKSKIHWFQTSWFWFKRKALIINNFTHNIHRRAFSVGDALEGFNVVLANDQTHSFLRFVADDFLGGKRRVANGQFIQINQTASFFHQFRETIQMSACTVVMDRYDGIMLGFNQATDGIGGSFLHFWVGALHGIELNTRAKRPRISRRNGRSAHANSIIFAAQNDHFIALGWFLFFGLAGFAITHATSQHNHFIEAQFTAFIAGIFLVFKSQNRACNQRLAKFIAEIRRPVWGFNQDVHRRLVKPRACWQGVFPRAVFG